MNDVYIKKHWNESNITFYLYFKDGYADKQIEVQNNKVFLTSTENPLNKDSMLYDQKLSELEVNKTNYISKEEFDKLWFSVSKGNELLI